MRLEQEMEKEKNLELLYKVNSNEFIICIEGS